MTGSVSKDILKGMVVHALTALDMAADASGIPGAKLPATALLELIKAIEVRLL